MATKKLKKHKPINPLTLGRYLRESREAAGLGLGDVSDHMGWNSRQFLWNLENEKSVMPLVYVKKLSALYKVKDLEMRQQIAKFLKRRIDKKWGVAS